MPKPDQDLLDGHFAGEHAASNNIDHKVSYVFCVTGEADPQINILPAGTDPEHPPVSHEAPAHPEPITLNAPAIPEVHKLNVAPEPLPAPPKGSVHLPGEEEKQEIKKKGEDLKKKGEQVEKKVEKKGKEYANKAKVW
jgi:hypothetical protein